VIGPTGAVRVMVATKPVDFPKGAEGLAATSRFSNIYLVKRGNDLARVTLNAGHLLSQKATINGPDSSPVETIVRILAMVSL
jgi:hypothetical protein